MTSSELAEQLAKPLAQGLAKLNLHLSQNTQQKLLATIGMLQEWNSTYNLTSITNAYAILTQHIFDSLSIYPYLYGNRIVDVGTGAGFPGIPLALACPDKQFMLLEATRKKVVYLQQLNYELGINNVEILHARSENYRPLLCYTSSVMRAVGKIMDTIALTKHLLCKNGKLLFMKGELPKTELAGVSEAFTISVHKIDVPGLDAERHLIIIEGN